jgi:hypothetical protein
MRHFAQGQTIRGYDAAAACYLLWG